MKLCLHFLLILSFCLSAAYCHDSFEAAQPRTLKEKFAAAEAGSYIVTQQNKTYTLLHLHSLNGNELLLEEISIPAHLVSSPAHDWKNWIEKGAEGHTSWILYAIDLEISRVTECYSFSREVHLSTESMNAFFITLIQLDLAYLPEAERLKTGPSAKAGNARRSKPWGPSMLREGRKIEAPLYDVYTSTWPHDQTELSGKRLILYFDKNSPGFPFPYWVQAREGAFHFKVQAVDSGKGLRSPKTGLPRRPPVFVNIFWKESGKAAIILTAPSYYRDFKLYAVDITANPRTTHAVQAQISRKNEQVFLEAEGLDDLLIPGHQYIWIAFSEEFDLYAESEHPLLWTKSPKGTSGH